MSITTVLFDLDGTLLPMDLDVFVQGYLRSLALKSADWGYDVQKFSQVLLRGIYAMQQNTGEICNEDLFWEIFTDAFGEDARQDEPHFEAFYHNEFQALREVCGFQPMAKEVIGFLREHGMGVVLATNPLFPRVGTHSRIRWAGLAPEDFDYITTYDNSRRCKPNPDYYRELLHTLNLKPEQCLMIGNDVEEDMIASQLGISVFLLTDCLISRKNTDLDTFPHGGYPELLEYVRQIV